MVPGLDGRPAPVVGKQPGYEERNSLRSRLDNGKAAGAGGIAQPALSRTALLDKQSDAVEMALQGADAAYAECMALIDTWQAERKGTITQSYALSLSNARAQLATAHVRGCIDSPITRRMQPSKVQKDRERRHREWSAWVDYCLKHKSKISIAEWRVMK